jgi:hypothetical protein
VETSFSATSVKAINDNVYVTMVKGSSCSVSRLRRDSIEPLTSLNSSSRLILEGSSEGLLVSSGDSLYLVSEGEAKLLLKASRPGNWF